MKFTIDEVEIDEKLLKGVVRFQASLEEKSGYDQWGIEDGHIQKAVVERVVRDLTEKVILERGTKIMASIADNQLINAILMKFAASFGNAR